MGNCQCQHQPPLLPGGKVIELGFSLILEPHFLQQFHAGSNPMIGTEKSHRLLGGNTFRQPGRLQLDPDHITQLVKFRRRVEPCHLQRSGSWGTQPFQAFQCGGLSGAIRSKQAKYLPCVNGKTDAVHSNVLAIRFAKIPDFNDGSARHAFLLA